MMSQHLYPIDIDCDALPYYLVRACRQVGFRNPEDVRWCGISRVPKRHLSWRALFHLRTWKAFLSGRSSTDQVCTCGRKLPELARYAFTLNTGSEEQYLLGQCHRCRTMFWEEA